MSRLPFPAWDTFEGDPRVTSTHMKLYRHLRSMLDFWHVRRCAISGVEHHTKIKRPEVVTGLRDLITWGYVIEHEPDSDNCRRCTLAYSVDEALRVAA